MDLPGCLLQVSYRGLGDGYLKIASIYTYFLSFLFSCLISFDAALEFHYFDF